jgi:two-component system nitrate/nitrite response regulator NarL
MYSILIVDDNPVIRRTLRACLLESIDCEVCGEAANGREAVEKVQELKPDLIILDLSMPVMNGLQAARELKRISPTVQLLMFTSFKSPNLEKEAVAAGCAAVIEKSDLQHLFSSVHRLLTTGN